MICQGVFNKNFEKFQKCENNRYRDVKRNIKEDICIISAFAKIVGRKNQEILQNLLTKRLNCGIIVSLERKDQILIASDSDWEHAGVAELADARDLKSRGTLSRAGSIPVSGTIYRGVEQLVARRAHNPEAVGSSPIPATRKKHLRKQVLFSTKSASGGINPPSVDEIASR